MTNDRKQAILKKIKNLLDLSQDKNSLHEAEAAAAKAQVLIMKYNIEEAELHGGETPSMENTIYPLYKIQLKNEGTWGRKMFHIISTFNFCKVISTKRNTVGYTVPQDYLYILGEANNVELVKLLAEQLMHQIKALEGFAWNQYQGYDKRNTFRRGYFQGAVAGIYTQLKRNQDRFKEDDKTNALIIRKDQALKEFVEMQFPNLRKNRSTSLSSADGYREGYDTGKSMNINTGLRGRGGSRSLGE